LDNENWHVWTRAGERFVLRRHGYGRTPEELEYEAQVMRHVAAVGWRVPVPLGAPVPNGDRLVSVCTYVPGTSHRAENAAQLRERGAVASPSGHEPRLRQTIRVDGDGDGVIIVVEGPSASGKSTWIQTHAPDGVIAETRPVADPPEDASAAARF